MVQHEALPRVALICHAGHHIDAVGLASWLASSLRLVGIVVLRDRPRRIIKTIRREIWRVGLLRLLDVIAFCVYYRLLLARADSVGIAQKVAQLQAKYPASLADVPRLIAADPNTMEVRHFLQRLHPDLMIARRKFILRSEIFELPSVGTFVLHPAICPEYRNAHGCFWVLVNEDRDRFGMTLLRADKDVDTGPIFLQATYRFNETRESHIVIQYRVILENLEAIRNVLLSEWKGEARRISTNGRSSAVWGQPWLSAYLRWKWAARRKLL